MSNELKTLDVDRSIVASVALHGDLSRLSPEQKVQYMTALCTRLGLDPVTQPLKLMKLNGREIVYADRGCAAQLNRLHAVSSEVTKTEQLGDLFLVYSRAKTPDGRFTDEIAAVPTAGLKGEALANAFMKARTKAMRRATLTHIGLGMLDESEVESIPAAQKVEIKPEAQDIETVIEWTEDQRQTAYTLMDQVYALAEDGVITEAKFDEVAAKLKGEIAAGADPEKVINRLHNFINRAEKKKEA